MKILISGSSGFIGKSLIKNLEANHSIYTLVRDSNKLHIPQTIEWDPYQSKLDINKIENFDIVINLSGKSIACLWTKKNKKTIIDSRIITTKKLVECFSLLKNPPKVFICASAIGIYESSNKIPRSETDSNDNTFLAKVCAEWEHEANKANNLGIRTINARFGPVLDPSGGMLEKMLLPFKLGLGGMMGSGNQYISWISLDDTIRAIQHIINKEEITGPINIVSPNPVTNKEFTLTLAKTLNRPAFMNISKILLKSLLGEMAEELFLKSIPVTPKKLIESSFNFNDTSLPTYLKNKLNCHKV